MPTPEEIREQILNSPAARPPPGVVPNFINPPNLRRETIIINGVVIALVTLMTWTRIFAKVRLIRRMLIEDYVLIVAWILYAGALTPILFIAADLPYGVHEWNMTKRQQIRHAYYGHINSLLYLADNVLLKTAIILQCLHFLVPKGVRNAVFWTCHILLWSNILFFTIFVFVRSFTCTPMNKIWDKTIREGSCRINPKVTSTASATFNEISDIAILLLPQPVIWRLNLTLRKKLRLSAIFMVGLIACIASSIRLHYVLYRINVIEDATYNKTYVSWWSSIEIACGFLVVCLPILPKVGHAILEIPFVSRMVPHSMRSLPHSSRSRMSGATKIDSHGHGSMIAEEHRERKQKRPFDADLEFDAVSVH